MVFQLIRFALRQPGRGAVIVQRSPHIGAKERFHALSLRYSNIGLFAQFQRIPVSHHQLTIIRQFRRSQFDPKTLPRASPKSAISA
jgi:hypothetical protein